MSFNAFLIVSISMGGIAFVLCLYALLEEDV